MLLHILKQIWTQRRRNVWIFSELLIVFALSWYIVDYAFVLVHNRMIPKGYDISDTYQIDYRGNITDENREAFEQFYTKIKHFPGVQQIFLSDKFMGVAPSSGSYNGAAIQTDTTKSRYHFQFKNLTSSDYFDVFKIYSAATGQIAKLNSADANTIVLTQDLAKRLFGDENPVGKTVLFNGSTYRVTDVVVLQKRFPYDLPIYMGYSLLDRSLVSNPEISIRVGDNFSVQQFKKEITSAIKSYKTVQKEQEFMWGISKEIRLRVGIMVFFLLNAALGVIGTFWFRNQARRGEIGLRMAMGSSRRKLLAQFIGEALLLMTLAAIPAICINIGLAKADVIKTIGEGSTVGYITGNKWLRFFITNGITYVALAIIVALSAWIPARRASKVHPVEALRDE